MTAVAEPRASRKSFAAVTVTRSTLADALSQAALVVGRGAAKIPVLTCVRIAPDGDGLRLAASDLDRTVSLTVPAEGALGFPVRVVPCQRLAAIVNQLPHGPIAIAAIENGVRITAGRARFDVSGFPADEFPDTDNIDASSHAGSTRLATSMDVDAPAFVAALSRCATFASNQPSRPILNGIHVHAEANQRLSVEATDGYSPNREWVARASGPSVDVIVPSPSVTVMAKLFAEAERLTVDLSDRRAIVVSNTGIRFSTNFVEGPYPDTSKVIPRETPHEATIDGLAFLAAVKRVAALSTDERFVIRLGVNADHVIVSGIGGDDGNAEDVVPCEATVSAPLYIRFNPKFLMHALALRTSGAVRLGLKSGETAMTLRDDGTTEVQGLLMPRRGTGEDS